MPTLEEKKEQVIEALKNIEDPELSMDIWTLGLVYKVDVASETEVNLLITYTSPMCPYGPAIHEQINDEMRALGFLATNIDVTFDPPWQPPAELRSALGI